MSSPIKMTIINSTNFSTNLFTQGTPLTTPNNLVPDSINLFKGNESVEILDQYFLTHPDSHEVYKELQELALEHNNLDLFYRLNEKIESIDLALIDRKRKYLKTLGVMEVDGTPLEELLQKEILQYKFNAQNFQEHLEEYIYQIVSMRDPALAESKLTKLKAMLTIGASFSLEKTHGDLLSGFEDLLLKEQFERSEEESFDLLSEGAYDRTLAVLKSTVQAPSEGVVDKDGYYRYITAQQSAIKTLMLAGAKRSKSIAIDRVVKELFDVTEQKVAQEKMVNTFYKCNLIPPTKDDLENPEAQIRITIFQNSFPRELLFEIASHLPSSYSPHHLN